MSALRTCAIVASVVTSFAPSASHADETKNIELDADTAKAKQQLSAETGPFVLFVTRKTNCPDCTNMESTVAHTFSPKLHIDKLDADAASAGSVLQALGIANDPPVPTPSFFFIVGRRSLGQLSGVHDWSVTKRWMSALEKSIASGRWRKQTPYECSRSIFDNLVVKGKVLPSDLVNAAHWLVSEDTYEEFKPSKLAANENHTRLAPAFRAYDFNDTPADQKTFPVILLPGDLLAYRLPWEKTGAVVLIRSYDPVTTTGEATVYEEDGAKVTDLKEFPLSTDAKDAAQRFIRAGVYWLRPLDTSLCSAKAVTSAPVNRAKAK